MNSPFFIPPSPEVIDRFARDVCRKLTEKDPEINRPEIVQGLKGFLSVLARAIANNLNRENGLVDNKNK